MVVEVITHYRATSAFLDNISTLNFDYEIGDKV